MRIIIISISSFLFYIGLCKLLSSIFNLPSSKSKKLIKKSNQTSEKKNFIETIEPFLIKVAKPISKIIPLSSYREREIQISLDNTELDYSAKLFIARNISIALLISLFSIPFFLLMPLLGFAVIGFGVLIAMNENSKTRKIAKDRKQYIEAEMPRFTQHISQAVRTSSNVTSMLEIYRPMAGKTFGKELSKTIADIKTSDVQGGLKRFSDRVNSSMVTEVMRGLCSIDNGIDQGNHFQLLAFTYRDRQNQLLKKEALKKPDKISAFGMVGLLGLIVQVFVIIGTQVIDNMGVFNM